MSLKPALDWEEIFFVKNLFISNHKSQQQIILKNNTLTKKNLQIYAEVIGVGLQLCSEENNNPCKL